MNIIITIILIIALASASYLLRKKEKEIKKLNNLINQEQTFYILVARNKEYADKDFDFIDNTFNEEIDFIKLNDEDFDSLNGKYGLDKYSLSFKINDDMLWYEYKPFKDL